MEWDYLVMVEYLQLNHIFVDLVIFLKMMHFKKGPWCDVMDGLYWKFIDRHKKFFLKNPRLAMMVRVSEKMNKERKTRIFKAANNFIKENTNG